MATFGHRAHPQTPFNPKAILSSSPAFATPVHPIRPPSDANRPTPILPILLPPATLRPIAFRTFTKKHNLTLTASALQALANFVGKHCGAAWREGGLGEMVLEEIARMWKRGDGKVIVDGEGDTLKNILKQLEGSMSGGKVVIGRAGTSLSRQASLVGMDGSSNGSGLQRQESFGISALEVEDEEDSGEKDPRSWLKIINAFEQPRMLYNATRKHFEKSKTTADFFPSASQKTELFRQRYHLIHQRVLRNESFQKSSITSRNQQEWKITQIANLLGRSGSSHLLLGLLTIAPTGTLAISDLTGSIALDLEQASSIDSVQTWLCPGMIVLVDGVYEEEFNSAGGTLGNMGGIGGTIGGRFTGLSIGAPRCETRATTLGLSGPGITVSPQDLHIGGGFGWVDFLGVGSERGVGSRMRKIEQRLLHNRSAADRTNSNKVVVLGEVNLDDPKALSALRKVLLTYAETSGIDPTLPSTQPPPLAFILLGNFVSHAAMSSTPTSTSAATKTTTITDSITYKEHFDALALLLSDFPHLLRSSTWIFVPGDNDPWPSAFSAGAAVPLPRGGIPDLFTSRVKRAFATANAEIRVKEERVLGEAVWTTNPSRVSLFGPTHEMVLCRDDVSGRLRRNAIPLKRQGSGSVAEGGGEAVIEARDGLHQQQFDADTSIPSSPPRGDDNVGVMDIDTAAAATALPSAATPSPSAAQSLTKTLLDQSHLSPFPLSLRPLHWSFAHALSLYPLPSALVLCDAEADPFVVGYQGCCVLNAGKMVGKGKEGVRWIEYDVKERRAKLCGCEF